jgi:hypothetical protein
MTLVTDMTDQGMPISGWKQLPNIARSSKWHTEKGKKQIFLLKKDMKACTCHSTHNSNMTKSLLQAADSSSEFPAFRKPEVSLR